MTKYSYETWGKQPDVVDDESLAMSEAASNTSLNYCVGYLYYYTMLRVHVDTVLGSCYRDDRRLNRIGNCVATEGLAGETCEVLALYISHRCDLVGDEKHWSVTYRDEDGAERTETIIQPHIVYEYTPDGLSEDSGAFALVDMHEDAADSSSIDLRYIEQIETNNKKE